MQYVSLFGALVGLGATVLSGPGSKPPDACKLVTLADVTGALGAGFTQNPAGALANSGDMSACLYQKGPTNTVAIAVLGAPDDDAKAAVLTRQDRQRRAGRTVTPLPGVCDVAFTVSITPSNTTLIAAKGPWQVEFQVVAGGKPDATAEQKLAKAACARLP